MKGNVMRMRRMRAIDLDEEQRRARDTPPPHPPEELEEVARETDGWIDRRETKAHG